MSCSYSDIAMERYDKHAISETIKPLVWFRFRDDIFIVWTRSDQELTNFVSIMNNVDPTKKRKFELKKSTHDGLDFLDLNLKFNNNTCKIEVDVYAKETNSFTYVMPSTCYPNKNINNVPYGVALRLRRICDTEEKFDTRSNEYSNYLIARDYKPSVVDKHFSEVKQITNNKSQARKPKPKANKDITKNHLSLPTILNYQI